MPANVLFNDLTNVGLAPEFGSRLDIVISELLKLLILHAGSPVYFVHSLGGHQVLLESGLVVGLKSLDLGIHDDELDLVRNDASLKLLSEVPAQESQAVSLEFSDSASFSRSVYWFVSDHLGILVIGPVGFADEVVPEVAEGLASSMVVAKLPLGAHSKDFKGDLEPLFFEVLLDDFQGVRLGPEVDPPGLKFGAKGCDLGVFGAGVHIFKGSLDSLAKVLFPLVFVAVGKMLESMVPSLSQVLILHHAFLELVANFYVEGSVHEASIELSNWVLVTN